MTALDYLADLVGQALDAIDPRWLLFWLILAGIIAGILAWR